MNNILIHIPHGSYVIPEKYKFLFYLSEKDLFQEQIKMTDSFTEDLFTVPNTENIVFPISRLVCDVERFRHEKDEEMTKQGMWVCYTKTSELKPLKRVNPMHKAEILKNYYDVHHKKFTEKVKQILEKYRSCLIIDGHSFASVPLPYELHADSFRPDICIGTDKFHTPKYLTEYFYKSFSNLGYKAAINNPFCGTIVPLDFYGKSKRVKSIMLEINRSLYMNEKTGEKNNNFEKVKNDIQKIITLADF